MGDRDQHFEAFLLPSQGMKKAKFVSRHFYWTTLPCLRDFQSFNADWLALPNALKLSPFHHRAMKTIFEMRSIYCNGRGLIKICPHDDK